VITNKESADLSSYGVGIATIELVLTNPNKVGVSIHTKLGYGLSTSGSVEKQNGIYYLKTTYPNQCASSMSPAIDGYYAVPANSSCTVRYALSDVQEAACLNGSQTQSNKCIPISSAAIYTSYDLTTPSAPFVGCNYGYEINPTTMALSTIYRCARSYSPQTPTVLQYGVSDYKIPVTPYHAVWTQIPDSTATYGAANASGSLVTAVSVGAGTYGHTTYTAQWNSTTTNIDYQSYFTSVSAAVGVVTNDNLYGFVGRSISGNYYVSEWNWNTGLNDNYSILACNSCQPQVVNPSLDSGLFAGQNGVIYTEKTQYQFNEATNTFILNTNLINPTETSVLLAVDAQGNAISYGLTSKSYYCSNVNIANSMQTMSNTSGMNTLSDFAVLSDGGIYEPKSYTTNLLKSAGGAEYKVNFNTCQVMDTPSYVTSTKNAYMSAQTPTFYVFANDSGASSQQAPNSYYAIPSTAFIKGYIY
jgi:hypothetical protein